MADGGSEPIRWSDGGNAPRVAWPRPELPSPSSTAARRLALASERITALLATPAAWWTIFGVVCVVLLAPLFLVDVPPVLDYPNHLARMYVLAFGQHDPILSRMYAQHWAIIPNLAIDLVLPELVRLLPIYVAGRIMLAAALLVPLLGVIAYHRAAFRTRSYWPLAAGLMAYNTVFIFGFMNFLISLGMALLIAAGWLRWRDRHPVAVALCGAAATTAIFFTHLFGLVFLAVLIGSDEVAALWRRWRSGDAIWSATVLHGLIAAVAFAPPILLVLASPVTQLDSAVVYRPLWHKLYCLTEPFLAYDGWDDALSGGVFLVGVYLSLRARRLLVAPGIGLAWLGLFGLYLICPFAVKHTGFVDARIPIMLGLLLFAGMRPLGFLPSTRYAVTAVLAFALVVRTTSLGVVWFDHNHDLADFRRVVSTVQPGSRVLVVSVDPVDVPDYWDSVPRGRRIPGFFRLDLHLPALLTIEHRAFWPYLFATPGEQPLVVRPPYDELSVGQGMPPDWQSLVVGYQVHPVTPTPYLRDWQRNFDYVLMLNAGGAGDLSRYLPDRLSLIAASDVAALFRIRRSAADP
jgi:hypothetical protein